jgi:predicted ribosomally synthesized peptide with SipW-like signal peptide
LTCKTTNIKENAMNTKTMYRTVMVLMAGLLCWGMQGCAALVAGGAAAGGTYAYFNGQADQEYNAGIQRTFNASLAACRDLGIAVEKQKLDGDSGKITGSLDGDRVSVTQTLKADNVTLVSIRVGLLGDETTSRRIHTAIENRLR